MITERNTVYCIQETWVVGNSEILVRGHLMFSHNRENRTVGSKGRIPGGVAIILSLSAVIAWKTAGSKPPLTTPLTSKFVGRFIGVKLLFPKMDRFERMLKGGIALFVASIYHPVDENEHKEFNDILNVILSSIPKSAEFIGGHAINTNVRKRKKMYGKALGPFGIDN